jgi:hypothetical protein
MLYSVELKGITSSSKPDDIYKNLSSEHSQFFGQTLIKKDQVTIFGSAMSFPISLPCF